MNQYGTNSRTPRVILGLLLLAVASVPIGAQAQDGETCDCSCETYGELQSAMQAMQSGDGSADYSQLAAQAQAMTACAGQCAQAWSQCKTERAQSEQESADRRTKDAAGEADTEFALGEPRDDLERFHGVYGDPDNPGRDYFVTAASRPEYHEGREIPPGYLMLGAMWGDVAPFYMKSVSELRFEQEWLNPGAQPIAVEFEVDGEGQATALRIESQYEDRGRLPRLRDLQEDW